MAQSKVMQNFIKLKCSSCKRINYHTRKNVRKDQKKLEVKKYCKWCKKSTSHKEAKR